MVLTAAQVAAFFTDADQMGIPVRTVNQLANEGIVTPGDLIDFDKDTIVMVAENLRRPGGREPNPDPNAEPQGTTGKRQKVSIKSTEATEDALPSSTINQILKKVKFST